MGTAPPYQHHGVHADFHGAGTARGSAARAGVVPASRCLAAPFEGKVATNEEFWRVQLEAIYVRRNPYKLHTVPMLMARYRGREILLYRKVCAAYDLDPTRFYADPAVWQTEGSSRGCGKDLVSAEESELTDEEGVEPVSELVTDEEFSDENLEGVVDVETDQDDMEEPEDVVVTDCSTRDTAARAIADGNPISTAVAYPIAGTNQPVASPLRTSEQFWRAQLEAIYRWKNPYKLHAVPAMLERYQGKEALLYRKVCMTYDLDPANFHVGIAASLGSEAAVWQQEAGARELSSIPRPLMSLQKCEPTTMAPHARPTAATAQGSHKASPMKSPPKALPRSSSQLSRLEVHGPVTGASPASRAIFQPGASQECKTPADMLAACFHARASHHRGGSPSIGRVKSDVTRRAREAGVSPCSSIRWERQDGSRRPSWKPMPREVVLQHP